MKQRPDPLDQNCLVNRHQERGLGQPAATDKLNLHQRALSPLRNLLCRSLLSLEDFVVSFQP
jgi:hypothetical protein